MNYDNVNACVSSVSVPINTCCEKSLPPDRTIKDNIMEATEILSDIEVQDDRIKNWLWLSDDETAPKMGITDLNSNIARDLEFEKRILNNLLFISDRLGC